MLARSMARTISIVGAGRVGTTLGKRLRQLGWRIGAVVTRSGRTARAAVRTIGAGKPNWSIGPEVFAADLVLVCTPDDAMPAAVRSIAKLGGRDWRGKVVLHTSGALD